MCGISCLGVGGVVDLCKVSTFCPQRRQFAVNAGVRQLCDRAARPRGGHSQFSIHVNQGGLRFDLVGQGGHAGPRLCAFEDRAAFPCQPARARAVERNRERRGSERSGGSRCGSIPAEYLCQRKELHHAAGFASRRGVPCRLRSRRPGNASGARCDQKQSRPVGDSAQNAGSIEPVQLATYADQQGTLDGRPITVHHLVATIAGANTDLFSGPENQLLQAELPEEGFALVRKGFVLTPPAKPVAPLEGLAPPATGT